MFNIDEVVTQCMNLITDLCIPNEMSNLTNVEGIVFNAAAYYIDSGMGDGSGLFTEQDVSVAFNECQEQLNLVLRPQFAPVDMVGMAESILFPPTVQGA